MKEEEYDEMHRRELLRACLNSTNPVGVHTYLLSNFMHECTRYASPCTPEMPLTSHSLALSHLLINALSTIIDETIAATSQTISNCSRLDISILSPFFCTEPSLRF